MIVAGFELLIQALFFIQHTINSITVLRSTKVAPQVPLRTCRRHNSVLWHRRGLPCHVLALVPPPPHRQLSWWTHYSVYDSSASFVNLHPNPQRKVKVPYLTTDLRNPDSLSGLRSLSSLMTQNPGYHCQNSPVPGQVTGRPSQPWKYIKKDIIIQTHWNSALLISLFSPNEEPLTFLA